MIQYTLKCDAGHRFDSWFQSAASFEKLSFAGHLACAQCGSSKVKKAMMAPRVSKTTETPSAPQISEPKSGADTALAALRKHVEENADYVGSGFADEARSMYLGATPDRAIYGEASGAQAKALLEDGIPVAPLPFVPSRKSN